MRKQMAQIGVQMSLACVLAIACQPASGSGNAGTADSGATQANAAAANPYDKSISMVLQNSENMIMKSADEMPEANYAFKPVSTVRTYGEILDHVADASYNFCSTAKGEANPHPGPESGAPSAKMPTSKADVIAYLKGAFSYCDSAYAGMKDSDLNTPVKMFGQTFPKSFVLALNASHDAEHYGNLVTYLRMKGLVPPSTAQQQQQAAAAKAKS